MGYETGKLRHRVEILRRVQIPSKFSAGSGKVTYEPVRKVFAGYSFNKGTKAMRVGALDAYDVVMFFFHASAPINRNNFIGFKNRVYQITSFNDDYSEDKIQVTAVEIVGTITRPEPPVSSPALDDTETEIKPEDI